MCSCWICALLEAATFQPDDVQRGQAGTIADDAAERDHVALDARHAADHRRPADAHELMDRRRTADHGMVADGDMAAHHRVVRDDDVVAEAAIMRDVHHRHQHAVAADRA